MSDSLNLAGFELIGGSTVFRLAPGYDFGSAQPDQATVTPLLLDGEILVGDRTHNRAFSLPLEVFAASRSDLTAQVDALAQALNVPSGQTFPLVWTPSGGLPMVWDCYRATVVRTRSLTLEASFGAQLAVTFQAGPFARSTVAQTLTAGGSALQLDNFDAARTGATLTTATKYEGSGSNVMPINTTTHTSIAVSRTFGSSQNISAFPVVRVRFSADTQAGPTPNLTNVVLQLTDAVGASMSVTATWGGHRSITAFPIAEGSWSTIVTFPLSSPGSVDLTRIASYRLSAQNYSATGSYYVGNIYVDDLRAVPAAGALQTTNAAVITFAGALGSARTPAALSVTGTSPVRGMLLHSPPATQDPDVTILFDVSSATTVTVPSTTANYDGTYAVWVLIGTGHSGAQTAAVTVTQFESGTSVAATTVSRTYTGPVSGGLVYVGNVTLPLAATPADNTTTSYSVFIRATAGTDTYTEGVFCDTRGQTVQVVAPSSPATATVYVDQPDPFTGFGDVLATATDRTAAYSTLGTANLTGGPILFEPGTNKILVLAGSGASPVVLTATLYPRWLDERVQ